ncbi:hypothetical protein B0J14DRAFT_488902 [Halenospora varia]|nr:hypothetical protein B0J14DRAFT_488902 [Halenospora varia]
MSPTSPLAADHQEYYGAASRPPTASRSQASSRAVSINSNQSDRGRNRISKAFSRRSSTNSTASTKFHEIVFDSKPRRNSSRTSCASGRKGPLDTVARAAANAVKAVKACWRCKIMRKQCDVDLPCSSCPKVCRSEWHSIGCRRGDLRAEMPQLSLCPNPVPHDLSLVISPFDRSPLNYPSIKVNKYSRESVQSRVTDIKTARECQGSDKTSTSEGIGLSDVCQSILGVVRNTTSASIDHLSPHILAPLNDCILDIAWEISGSISSDEFLDVETPGTLLVLLQSAALYQAKLETDQLIPQSLVCLRSSLEALRAKNLGQLHASSHQVCTISSCKIECISNLEMHVNLYVDELSRVLFRKDNKHNKRWWLSVFYSLCIQSYVRRGIVELVKPENIENPSFLVHPAWQYLLLAVRLFIASSSTYDPLTGSVALAEAYGSRAEDIAAAKKAVNRESWESMGVTSSAEYLWNIYSE